MVNNHGDPKSPKDGVSLVINGLQPPLPNHLLRGGPSSPILQVDTNGQQYVDGSQRERILVAVCTLDGIFHTKIAEDLLCEINL